MHQVTLIPGDGIGPEIATAVRRIIDASGAAIDWDVQEAGENQMAVHGTPLPQSVIDSIRRTGVALKGPITTPVGTGFRSVNVALRKELDLYANLRPAKTYPNVKTRYENVDIVLVRENTEDLYAGVEHMVGKDAAESIKIFTRAGCQRILRYAFEYAKKNGRKKVTAVHKANIMKCTDGMFLEEARKMAEEYPEIEFEDRIIDALCMKLVQTPEMFDV
ncbi:MAG: NAD-dependent isocitrate dehydrogenase, partial [Clostridia bacterium]|nr:NAD-dependent isocitrate dehydrogenase [Clostridia bacterium]